MRWRMREERERESRRERECFVSAAAWLTERMGDRAECALCVSVYIYVCIYVYSTAVTSVHKLLNAFAWLVVKKRSHAERRRALF